MFEVARRALWQVYEPPRYMTVAEAVAQLLEVEEAEGGGAYGPDTLAVGVARLGSPDQLVCRIRSCQTCNRQLKALETCTSGWRCAPGLTQKAEYRIHSSQTVGRLMRSWKCAHAVGATRLGSVNQLVCRTCHESYDRLHDAASS